uniref:DUF1618 domain-containing protein n=1 Tax=Aegilops tauschii TaxID=37682 RepID=M8BP29_AEGTA
MVRETPSTINTDSSASTTYLELGDFFVFYYVSQHFALHLYNSKTKTWGAELIHLDSPQDFEFHSPNKGITIRGELGSVGWVDLRWGIVIYALLLLDIHQSLRYILLPSPLPPGPLKRYPLYVRNIIVLQRYIKYFHDNDRPGSNNGSSPICQGWIAATKKFFKHY